MVVIGIVSKNDNTKKLIKDIFVQNRKKTVITDNYKINRDEINCLADLGVEYLIVHFHKERIKPIYLDILILENCNDITMDLIKCVAKDTRLLYNQDREHSPIFIHPNAISYGLSYSAEATLSSIDDKTKDASFVYCLQKGITTLDGNFIDQCEKIINYPIASNNISEIIAAVTCSLICGISIDSKKTEYFNFF